jgi:hypothetical protein
MTIFQYDAVKIRKLKDSQQEAHEKNNFKAYFSLEGLNIRKVSSHRFWLCTCTDVFIFGRV